MPQTSFNELLTQHMQEEKPIDFLYPGSKKNIFEGKIKFISKKLELARVEFLNCGKPETLTVPLDNIYIPN